MKNTLFLSVSVGRVGTVLVRPVSRPTVEQITKVALGSGGLDTPSAIASGYSTTEWGFND
jgi:hypothetical protein